MYLKAKALTVGVVLGLGLGLAWTHASPLQQASAAGVYGDPLPAESARSLMSRAVELEAAGRLHDADAAYRSAWWSPETRKEATRALRILHDRRDFDLPVDEQAVESTLRDLGGHFRRTETAHFVILSNCTTRWTAARSRLLERAHHEFFRVMDRMGYPAHPPRHKMLCVLIDDHAEYAHFARNADNVHAGWVAGYYAGLSNRVVLYNDLTGPAFSAAFDQLDQFLAEAQQTESDARHAARAGKKERAESLRQRALDLRRHEKSERARVVQEARQASESKMIHEAIHLIAFNTGVQSRAHEYPFWLTEGLAMAFETDRPNAAFGPDCAHARHRESDYWSNLERGRALAFADLIGVSEVTGESSIRAETLYSHTAVLFQRLFDRDRDAIVALLERYLEQPAGDLAPAAHRELFSELVGDPILVEARLGLAGDAEAVARISATGVPN